MPEPTALLALPGLGLGPEAWRPTLEHLTAAGDRRADVLVCPGYGAPAHPRRDLDPRAIAEAALARLPAGDSRVVLLGHSASSQLVAHLARLDPARVAGLVLVGPTTDPRAATWPRLQARWLATAVHETPQQVPALARQYTRTTFRAMARALDAARHDAILETLDAVSAPVLVIRGPLDRICPADWADKVAASGGSGSRHVTLAAGAHMVPLTHGHLVADAVAGFLTELDQQDASDQPAQLS
ncbi:alpha/beta fold hydrolase [Knoellia sp. CPCC 206435]|uniref:alpha/beta fold hydrolase n=1 Tax=Knoellia terrae TaxID=3404797 RepID=UPI003B428202